MNEIINTINNRISLRKYANKKIKQEHVNVIINSAIRAPTAVNMMLYSIIQVEDQDKKNILGKTCNHPWISKAPLILLFVADMQRVYDYYRISNVEEYCKQNELQFETPKESNLMMSCCDALIAAQNTVLAAESLGIGSCYVGDIMGNYEKHKEMFKLPKWVFPITLVCYGYYSKKTRTIPTNRFDKKFIHFKDTYKHLSKKDFDEMFYLQKKRADLILKEKNINNAQHLYNWWTLGAPEIEEKRSVKILIDNWIN